MYLNSETSIGDPNLGISGYNVSCVDYPSSNKREGVCISFFVFFFSKLLIESGTNFRQLVQQLSIHQCYNRRL